jgi:kanamycin kinase
VSPPPLLARLAPDWEPVLAYRIVPWLSTWRLTGPGGAVRFAKVHTGGAGRHPGLLGEAERLRWAAGRVPVPHVVAVEELDGATVLVTDALRGCDATDPVWRRHLPALAVALGTGLRAFHDALDASTCPFPFDLERALSHVRRRVEADEVDPAGFHPEHARLTPRAALGVLESTAPRDEDLVVCHGDYCPPNVMVTAGGGGPTVCGYVDLGELGVADRWWDVAVGAWSVGWNFGRDLEPAFYEGYGVLPDAGRIAFFRLLYDLVS